jgi:hypothetical protein
MCVLLQYFLQVRGLKLEHQSRIYGFQRHLIPELLVCKSRHNTFVGRSLVCSFVCAISAREVVNDSHGPGNCSSGIPEVAILSAMSSLGSLASAIPESEPGRTVTMAVLI